MSAPLTIAARQLLEPLSKATETLLEPVNFFDSDFLELDVDKKMEKFVATVVGYSAASPFELSREDIVEIDAIPRLKCSPSHIALGNWWTRIPERKEASKGFGNRQWEFAATDVTALVIHHVWPEHKIRFVSEDAEVFYNVLIKRFMAQTKSALMIAQFKADGTVPKMPNDFIEHADPNLRLAPYQKIALLASLNQEGYGLFMEQGTGKTPVAVNRVNLEASRKRKAGKGMYRCLVICPKNLRMNWEKEFSRFSVHAGKVGVLRGGLFNRQRTLIDSVRDEDDCVWSVTVTSVDSIKQTEAAIKRVPWDMVIVDELHYAKSASSTRFKQLRDIEESCSKSRMGLTGTPIANTIMDLFAQFEFLGKGVSGFSNFSAYRKFYGTFKKVDQGGTAIERLNGIRNVPLIQERLARIAFTITKAEADLQLPEKLYSVLEAEMTANQRELYNQLAKMLIVEIEEALESRALTAEHILTKLLRLAQITSGHVKWDDRPAEPISGGNPKIDALVESLKEEDRDPKAKSLVWCCFVEDMRAISERLHKEGIKHVGYHPSIHADYRKDDASLAEQAFNKDDSIKVFIGNPASGGVGLTLIGYDRENVDASTCYCDREYFFSCNWSAVQRSQAEDRAHRRGTRRVVQVIDLMVPGTIDEEIRARLSLKKEMALAVQDIRGVLATLKEQLS